MFRALWNFIKSPVHTFPALAAAIGCLVSGYSTFNGISEIFPEFNYSVLAAFGLAAIIQLGMLSATISMREQPAYKPMLGAMVVMTVIMSSFTSYVFYYRGFSEETISKGRQIERYESLRGFLVDSRSQTAGTLGILREASAELQRRIEIEEASGGGLRNISNPYLQKLIGESNLLVDLNQVASGTGERYRFLTSVLPRLQQMQVEVAGSLAQIDAEIAVIADANGIEQESLRASYARASAAIPVDRIRQVRGEFVVLAVDPTILDTRPLEEEEYWQRAVAGLAGGEPSAIVFAFIAVFLDTMIVFFAFIAGETRSAVQAPRVPVSQWLQMAYGVRSPEGVHRWIAALDGTRLKRGSTILHRVDLRQLDDVRDAQCGRFLRQDGHLRQVMLEDGRTAWCLTETAYRSLVNQARELAEATPVAAAVQQEPVAG